MAGDYGVVVAGYAAVVAGASGVVAGGGAGVACRPAQRVRHRLRATTGVAGCGSGVARAGSGVSGTARGCAAGGPAHESRTGRQRASVVRPATIRLRNRFMVNLLRCLMLTVGPSVPEGRRLLNR